MKGFKLLFALCLGLLAFQAPGATDSDDTVRAAVRRDATSNTVTQKSRQRITSQNSGQNTQKNTVGTRGNVGRGTAVREKTPSSQTSSRTTAQARTPLTNTGVSGRTTTSRVVSERNSGQQTVSSRVAKAQSTTRKTTARTATPTRTTGRFTGGKSATRVSRAATMESGAIMANYSHCREVYYQCMDEFCANKDSQLKRCACSSRVNEFNNVKKQLAKVEDKMLDFNQRLLTVNMDAEDVDAMLTSTEGEDAFYETEDKTKSKKMLDSIAKKLNKAFDSSEDALSMSAISLSLDTDSAFDSVDSFMGSATTTKTGTALYAAALPVCREMALEICSEEEFSIMESGYQMQIEQDCNTVAKAYQTQTDQARTRVFESNALLDISRLDIYQKRNSDDVLTCKKKMLDMLTDTTICGTDLGKCLDMSGKYIDPTTGNAFLTEDLSELSELLTRPASNQKWSTVPGNDTFVTFLNKKKTLLEPATENCQDIANSVWNDFLEDALAKIKLAQEAKLEEIRQACTTLNTQCLDNAAESINNFDARSLSVFGVSADRTVNSMCSDVKTSCEALLNNTGWGTGMHNIATIKTFDTIISSCTQVGRNCIIQSCRSMSSNFGLCNDIALSINRHSILNRTSCWDEVLACVASADYNNESNTEQNTTSTTVNIMNLKGITNFYSEIYENSARHFDICQDECNRNNMTQECAECRIAERIWGNCESNPNSFGTDNQVTEPLASYETLMSWFVTNTNTKDNDKNCSMSRCEGVVAFNQNDGQICLTDMTDLTSDRAYCPVDGGNIQMTIYTNSSDGDYTNCCADDHFIQSSTNPTTGSCCEHRSSDGHICLPNDSTQYTELINNSQTGVRLVCIGADTVTGSDTNVDYPNGSTVTCNGTFVIIKNNRYFLPNTNSNGSVSAATQYSPSAYYKKYDSSDSNNPHPNIYYPDDTHNAQSWFIEYD